MRHVSRTQIRRTGCNPGPSVLHKRSLIYMDTLRALAVPLVNLKRRDRLPARHTSDFVQSGSVLNSVGLYDYRALVLDRSKTR